MTLRGIREPTFSGPLRPSQNQLLAGTGHIQGWKSSMQVFPDANDVELCGQR